MSNSYLSSAITQFKQYKALAEKAIDQLNDEDLKKQLNPQSNSVGVLAKHLAGNILSRWTDFLNADGEKPWRNKPAEFINDINDKQTLFKQWNEAWACLFQTLESLKENDLEKKITIRQKNSTVTEAINRQLTHYAYHVGQIIYAAKLIKGSNWKPLFD